MYDTRGIPDEKCAQRPRYPTNMAVVTIGGDKIHKEPTKPHLFTN
jgi:hypothetical protein